MDRAGDGSRGAAIPHYGVCCGGGVSAPTLLVDPSELEREAIELESESYRHLFRARRVSIGERVRLVDGSGAARWAIVVGVDQRRAQLALGEVAPHGEPAAVVGLVVPALRPERTSLLVEKATELGVRSIHWFGFERTPRAAGPAALERMRRVARAAVEQSGRSRLPELGVIPDAQRLAERIAQRHAVILDPAASESLTSARPALLEKVEVDFEVEEDNAKVDVDFEGRERNMETPRLEWLLIVGPEGGLSDREQERMAAAGALPYRLGATILRAETAAILGAGILLCG
jgi:16S rRNA (uracil1498-N3)-methyltransferase